MPCVLLPLMMSAPTTSARQSPNDFLKTLLGRPVVVKLNSGADYRGVLACLDGYMNIALEQTEEYVNGQLKVTKTKTNYSTKDLANRRLKNWIGFSNDILLNKTLIWLNGFHITIETKKFFSRKNFDFCDSSWWRNQKRKHKRSMRVKMVNGLL